MEVSGDDEASFLNSMDSSAYDCVRCDLPVGMTEEPPESWASCASDPRAQLKAKMLLCGHRSRTSGASSGAFGEFPDASVWLRAVAACESFLAPEARKRGVFWLLSLGLSGVPRMDLHPNGLSFGCLLEVGFFGTSSPDFNKQHLRARPAPSSATFSLTRFPLQRRNRSKQVFPMPGGGFCEARAPWLRCFFNSAFEHSLPVCCLESLRPGVMEPLSPRRQRQTSQLMEQQCRESKDVQQRLGATLQQSFLAFALHVSECDKLSEVSIRA